MKHSPFVTLHRFTLALLCCSLGSAALPSIAGHAQSQMRVTVQVVSQCTLRLHHTKPRNLYCAGLPAHAQPDMRVEWHESAQSPHLLHAHVHF